MGIINKSSHSLTVGKTVKRETAAIPNQSVIKFVCFGKEVQKVASTFGWLPGARYTNLRDIRRFDMLGFLDIDWKVYNFRQHLAAAKSTRPLMTVAKDIETWREFPRIMDQAYELSRWARYVVIVPKARSMRHRLDMIPDVFVLGFSVPTRYGKSQLPPSCFRRPVHLLGGRPDVQRELARRIPVVSLDCNRFTLDAQFGDYFDGQTFRPHPLGGYKRCLRDSMRNINALWDSYARPGLPRSKLLRLAG